MLSPTGASSEEWNRRLVSTTTEERIQVEGDALRRLSRARKQMIHPSSRPIGRKSDPFLRGDLEDAKISCGIKVPCQAILATQRPVRDRIGDHIEAGLLEHAYRSRHVIGRGDEQPALRRFGMNQSCGETRVLVRAAGLVLQCHTGGIDAKIHKEFSRLQRLGRSTRRQRAGSAGKDDPSGGVTLGELRGLHDALPLVEDALTSRLAHGIIDRASENDDPVWRGHIGRGWGKRSSSGAASKRPIGVMATAIRTRSAAIATGRPIRAWRPPEYSAPNKAPISSKSMGDANIQKSFDATKNTKALLSLLCLWQGAALVASRAVA